MTGRTTADVLTDPRNADLVRQADECFAEAENATTAEEAFGAFSRGMIFMRKIDAAERQRSALLQLLQAWEAPELKRYGTTPPAGLPPRDLADTAAAADAPESCAMGCSKPCARQETTGWCPGMS